MADVSAPMEADRSASSEDSGMAVLNAAASLTLQRTIVEAFVKLVVCRKVTVQQVATVSGQILDSSTTQEEDSPVILEVHRHEIGNVLSAFASCRTPHCDPDTHHPCRNIASAASHKSKADEKRDRNHHCDYPTSQEGGISSSSPLKGSLPSEAGVDKSTSASSVSKCAVRTGQKLDEATRPGRTERISREMCGDSPAEIRAQRQSADRRKSVDSVNFSATHMQTDSSVTSVNSSKTVSNIDRQGALSTSTLTHILCGGSSGDDASVAPSHGQSVQALPDAEIATDHSTVRGEGEEEVGRQVPMEEEPESDLWSSEEKAPITELFCRPCSESHTSPTHRTKAGSLTGQQCESGDSADSGGEGVSGNREGYQDTVGMCSGRGTTQSLPGSNTRTEGVLSTGNCLLSSGENDGEEMLSSEQHQQLGVVLDAAESYVQVSKTVLDCSNTEETLHEETDMLCAVPSDTKSVESNHASEDDAEQDMLVIDISSSVSEPACQAETGDSSDCTETRAVSKPDPFAHLLTSFPPLDSTHSEASHSGHQDVLPGSGSGHQDTLPGSGSGHQDTLPGSGTPPVKDGDREPRATVTVKAEPDDDCMITAAFISPARKKSCSESRLAVRSVINPHAVSHSATKLSMAVSHPVTNQNVAFGRGINPGRPSLAPSTVGLRGEDGLGRAAGMRSQPHFGQMRMSSLHQFHRSTVARETESHTALDPCQTLTSHSRLGAPLPPPATSLTSKPYIPNFLASTSQAADHTAEILSFPPAAAQGPSPIDYSQQTYQCNLCCKIFLHKHKFERHSLMCGGHRPFRCKICSKGFNQRAHLDTHMKFHIGIKRYRCDACRKAYVMKGDLIRHLKTRGHRLTLQTQGLHGVP